MIVATAGHVDHGKTALIQALTGVDTDRLPEEKTRGLSIDLGFAYVEMGGRRVGFIDVPGHERFVRNMVAGVAGIDYALLVVAADDGPMPQTAEHVAILDMLGISRGAVAVTKVDRTDETRVEEVATAAKSLLEGTALDGAPVLPVSAHNGDGVDVLRDHISKAASVTAARPAAGNFRLAIDRAFTIRGAGLTVTGTVFSGAVGLGDHLLLSPPDIRVRVRGIHTYGLPAERGAAGQRCAVNIAGADGDTLNKKMIQRGDWLVAEPIHAPTKRFDARIRLLAREDRPLRHWSPVHVHVGAAHSPGRIALLDGTPLVPGADGLAQLVTDRPMGVLRGDRLVLRDPSAQRTIGGGGVLDPFAPGRGRARPERHAILRAMDTGSPNGAITSLLELSPAGVSLDSFARAWNLTPVEASSLWDTVPMRRAGKGADLTGISERHYAAMLDSISEALGRWHAQYPAQLGPNELELQRDLRSAVSRSLLNTALRDLSRQGRVTRVGTILHLPDHVAALSTEDEMHWQKIKPIYDQAGDKPPRVREIADEVGLSPARAEALLRRVSQTGLLTRVSKNRFFPPQTLRRLAAIAERLAAASSTEAFQPAEYRDASGIGRNLTIELLEYFDEAGFTRRVKEGRMIQLPATDIFGTE